MRISGGEARGIPLRVPKGDAVRPATDGLRQAVFSSLAAWLPGARFADLFAGSGGYGLEAFSRGAAGGTFVEKSPKALACLRENVEAVARSAGRPAATLSIVPVDALTWEPPADDLPDLVFIDPPYEVISEVAPILFGRLAGFLASKPDALVVFEAPGELALDAPGWVCRKRLGKGARQPTASIFVRAKA
jgi:16S rRNA (guanine966-N2)-methyltransferase